MADPHAEALRRGDAGYLDPDTGLFVLTAATLAERGQCCDQGCRHCPFRRAPTLTNAMLEMKATCERCDAALPATSGDARICSYECTFCAACADDMNNTCPNCGGELLRRPARA